MGGSPPKTKPRVSVCNAKGLLYRGATHQVCAECLPGRFLWEFSTRMKELPETPLRAPGVARQALCRPKPTVGCPQEPAIARPQLEGTQNAGTSHTPTSRECPGSSCLLSERASSPAPTGHLPSQPDVLLHSPFERNQAGTWRKDSYGDHTARSCVLRGTQETTAPRKFETVSQSK